MLFLGFSAGLPFMLVFRRCRRGCAKWASSAPPSGCCPGRHHLLDQVLLGASGRSPAVALLHRLLGGGAAGCCSPSRHRGGLFNMAHLDRWALVAMAALALLVRSRPHAGRRHRAWRIEAVRNRCRRDGGGLPARYRIAIMVGSAGALWIAATTLDGGLHGDGRDGRRGYPDHARDCRARSARERFSLAHEQRVVDWVERKRTGRIAAAAGSWFVVRGLPVRDFFTRLRHEARDPDARVHRGATGSRLHHGVMATRSTRRRLHAEGDRGVAKLFGLVCRSSACCSAASPWPASARSSRSPSGSLAVIASNLMFMTLAFQDDPSLTGLASW